MVITRARIADSYDFVIVGGGAAGCVLASRLSDDPALSVLLIEAGPGADRPSVRHPAGVRWTVGNPRFDWKRIAEPDASAGGRRLEWPSGKLLGGGGSINTMFYIEGERVDFDAWVEMGADGWSHDAVRPYYRRVAETLSIRRLEQTAHPIARGFVEGLVALGFTKIDDYNDPDTDTGVAYGQVNQWRGRRSSPALDYPGLDGSRDNLTIATGTAATRLVVIDGRCTGVALGSRVVSARREVALTAGAIASPALLLRSGIAGTEIGANLQEHCGVRLVRAARVPSINTQLRGIRGIGAAFDYLHGRGLLTELVSQASAFFLADDADPHSKAKLSLFPFGYVFDGKRSQRARHAQAMFTLDLCWPQARGTVTLAADGSPRIAYPMLACARDLAWMIAAVRKAQALLSSPPLQRVLGESIEPKPGEESDAAIEAYIRAGIMPFYHASGSCRMGSDAGAVVDPALRVRGVAGLRIADTSIMPRLVAANTNATAMMIGERAADLIRADL